MSIAGSGAVADSGKTLEIWRRQADGSWRITRAMSSSDASR
jgi:ketosteroid isomerase-like protein